MTRRNGMRAVLGALGLAVAPAAGVGAAATARDRREHRADMKRKPQPAGPCGDGSVRDNRCTKNGQCCTNICKLSVGNRNKDGKGRCRCLRNGRPCSEDRNCCNAACVAGHCRGTLPLVPTGNSCTPADTCADPNASCTTYQHDAAAGTFCLLPRRALCSGDSQCVSGDCAGGVCVPCSSPACGTTCGAIVCATCTYQTVQAAIDAASPGDIIDIGAGTYSEDLAIAKDLTLRACKGTRVVLKNASYNTRTITVTGNARLSLVDIIVDAYKDLTANPKKAGGGIRTDGDLTLYRSSVVQNAGGWNSGGGISVIPGDGKSATLTVTDRAIVRANRANWEGAGCYGKGTVTAVFDQEAAIRDNVSDSYSAGMNFHGGIDLTIADDVVIDGNIAEFSGGGIFVGRILSSPVAPSHAIIRDRVVISNNISRQSNGAGIMFDTGLQNDQSTLHVTDSVRIIGNSAKEGGAGLAIMGFVTTIDGDVEISGNAQTGVSPEKSESGGAVEFSLYNTSPDWPAGATGLTIAGNTRIVNNTTAQGGGALYLYRSPATIEGSAVISGNTATGNGGGAALSNGDDNTKPAVLTIGGQATIAGNTAASGGGVYSRNAGNTLTVTTGTVTGNTPDNCAGTGISC